MVGQSCCARFKTASTAAKASDFHPENECGTVNRTQPKLIGCWFLSRHFWARLGAPGCVWTRAGLQAWSRAQSAAGAGQPCPISAAPRAGAPAAGHGLGTLPGTSRFISLPLASRATRGRGLALNRPDTAGCSEPGGVGVPAPRWRRACLPSIESLEGTATSDCSWSETSALLGRSKPGASTFQSRLVSPPPEGKHDPGG